jgi:lipopolysaccharide export system permease protein
MLMFRYKIKILDLYIFKEILTPFFITLFFWTTLFVALVFKEVIGEILGKGIDTSKIIEYIIYLIGDKITITIPIACLFAGILSTGRLSSDSEIIAMRAAGISFRRIYSIYLFFGFLSMVLVMWINFYWGPISSKAKTDFEEWLKTYHSLSLVKSGRFMNVSETENLGDYGQDIYVQYRDGSILKNIQIRKWKNSFSNSGEFSHSINSKMMQIIQAEKGRILSRVKEDGERENFIRLENGYMIETDPNWTKIEITDFRNGFMDYVLPKIQKKIGKLDVKPENYTFLELFDFLNKLEKGQHKIDFESLTENLNIKIDESEKGQRLPSIKEMEDYISKNKIWLLQNFSHVDKPGGPTTEEYNRVAQTIFRYEIFLKDVEKTKRKFEVEIHKRIAVPIACLLFLYISFPLGMVSRRSGKGMNFSLALFVFFFYYILLMLGLSKAYDGIWHPALGAWLADIGLLILGNYIMSIQTDEVSFKFNPFKPLRNFFIKYIYNHPFYIKIENKIDHFIEFAKKIVVKKIR